MIFYSMNIDMLVQCDEVTRVGTIAAISARLYLEERKYPVCLDETAEQLA
jgi:hypothetical protein